VTQKKDFIISHNILCNKIPCTHSLRKYLFSLVRNTQHIVPTSRIDAMLQQNNSMSKYWCFTINNTHDLDDLDGIKRWTYCIVGRETGDQGTPHLQGFIVYFARTRFQQVKKQLPRAHIEKMMGTPKQASEYCKKEGDFEEFGTLPKDYQGGASGGEKKRDNYRAMIQLAKEDKFDDIIEIDPVSYVQHYHAYKRIKQDNPQKVQNLPDVCGTWYYGEPGVGKSYKARLENEDIYDKPLNKWWDGYKGEDCILLDDVGLKQGDWLGDLLKRWADRYSFPAEQKGTTVQIRPKKIVVTSNYQIEHIFQDVTLCKALQRRFKEIEVTQWKPAPPPPEPEFAMFTDDEDEDSAILAFYSQEIEESYDEVSISEEK